VTIFTLTIDGSTAAFGASRRAETTEIARLLAIAAQQINSGAATTGNLVDSNRNNVGTFTYTPIAAS
jgi:hypothetical protein